MNIRKYIDFVNENNEDSRDSLHYYCFDWDDNILHMSTVIHVDKKEGDNWVPMDVSTEEFAKIRNDKENYRLRDNNPDEAFNEFKDEGPRADQAFIEDVKDAISQGRFAPSWDKFLQCLVDGSIFAIITARGHEPNSIKEAVRYIIETQLNQQQQDEMMQNLMGFNEEFDEPFEMLIDEYLDLNYYFGVSSNYFMKKFKKQLGITPGGALNPEKAKEVALKYFIDKMHKYGKEIGAQVRIGFSDDDPKNVEHVEKVMRGELSIKYPLSTLRVYDTSKRGYKKITINENLENMEDDEVNPEYEWFVVFNNSTVISGWEYEEDAWDSYNEMIEGDMELENSLSVMDLEECKLEEIDPFDYENWANLSDVYKPTNESKKIKKARKTTSENHGMAIDVKDALPKEDLGNDKMKMESFSEFIKKTK